MSTEGYFARRWTGRVPLGMLLWPEMLGIGTLVNLAATFLAFVAAIQGAPALPVLVVHASPLPYNLFLFASVLRSPEANAVATAIASLWFVGMLLV